MNNVSVTKESNQIHISLNEHTLVIPITSGFTFDSGNIVFGDVSIPCSMSDFKKVTKRYHQAMKPPRSAHRVWAVTVCFSVCICTFALLLLGLSQNDEVIPPPAFNPSQQFEQPLQPPVTEAPVNENDSTYFPFANS